MHTLRFLRWLLTGMLSVAASAASQAQTPASHQTVVLRGARVIDGAGGTPLDNATIVIRDGRVVAIGPSTGTPVPNGAEVVDYTNKTIIPGLISGHSHVGIFVGLKAAPENCNRDSILRQLKQLEAYGVTTVMALGLNGPLFYELRPECGPVSPSAAPTLTTGNWIATLQTCYPYTAFAALLESVPGTNQAFSHVQQFRQKSGARLTCHLGRSWSGVPVWPRRLN